MKYAIGFLFGLAAAVAVAAVLMHYRGRPCKPLTPMEELAKAIVQVNIAENRHGVGSAEHRRAQAEAQEAWQAVADSGRPLTITVEGVRRSIAWGEVKRALLG